MSAITDRRDMGLYEVPLSMSLLGFGMGIMLANFNKCGIILLSGKSLQLLCILPFGILCLSSNRMMFVKIQLAVCNNVGGYCSLSETDSVSSGNCVQSAFL